MSNFLSGSFLLIFLSISNYVESADDKSDLKNKKKLEKLLYTQKDFDKKVEQEVYKKLSRVTGDSLKNFAQSLLEKERALDEKKRSLRQKEDEINIVEKDLNSKMREFRKRQKQIIGCIDENKKNESKRIDHIVQVIGGMKPANAAAVLAVQDSDISVQIISKLNPERVSKIFNLMDKEISARLQKSYINMKR